MTYRKKLIEVALPLDAINKLSVEEKAVPRRGHPQTIHYWWARRPLATCRAVLFASLVDDPSSHPEMFPTEEAQEKERQRLFGIIVNLVKWENSDNEHTLNAARVEIQKSCGSSPPPVLDPFCGGGSIPLEAQRLGLQAYGNDLNPVAVLITKALIEIPPQYTGHPPMNPDSRKKLIQHEWHGASGLADDIRFYGHWMLDEARKRIGTLYPPGPNGEKILAYQWARTVKCPNPACHFEAPLTSTFRLSLSKNSPAWAKPVIDESTKRVRFIVVVGEGTPLNGTVNRRGATCVRCGSPIPFDYIRSEGRSGHIGTQLMAIIAEGGNGRVYLSPTPEHEKIAIQIEPKDAPETELPEQALGFRVQVYGMTRHRDLFTPRQLVAMTTFSDLVNEVPVKALHHAQLGVKQSSPGAHHVDGDQLSSYGDALAVYLSFAVSRLASYNNSICHWNLKGGSVSQIFARQAISMSWDFIEVCPLEDFSGNWAGAVSWVSDVLDKLVVGKQGIVNQIDATAEFNKGTNPLISTDPPYYDNIGYADLSDFFYVWLRRSLNRIFPDLFSTLLVPKAQELVATPYRFGGDKEKAQQFFEDGLGRAFARMHDAQHPDYPLTIYYAFKQVETDNDDRGTITSGTASTGWETMLEGLIKSNFSINGTWPVRTERLGRPRDTGSNALASSIVLVCRHRSTSAPLATRREFVTALKKELPIALKNLQHGNIAPVDLAQATIGPGMAIFSRYSKVLEADGNPMSVRSALQIINQELDAYLTAQEGEMDRDTRFCLSWFEQYGMNEGPFGEADVLARAKNTAVQGLVDAGVVHSKAGKVRLLKREEYKDDWDPVADSRVTVWECTQHLIQRLNTGGEEAAARLVNKLGGWRSEEARALAYRLFSLCERQKWADEALAYNTLVVSWPGIQDKASQLGVMPSTQGAFQYE